MSTGTKIIQDALKKIGAHSIASPAGPETLADGLVILNDMLQSWRSKGIIQDAVPLKVVGSELGEPGDARNGIVANLALWLAPDFDNGQITRVTPQLKDNARKGLNDIKDAYQVFTVPKKIPSSTLPRGAGNAGRYNDFYGPFFNGEESEALDG